MVVIAIIAIISWVGFGLIGVLRGGDPLEAAATAIKGTVTKSRAQALASGSRLNLLVDFEKNQLIPLERRTVANFSFESDVGSFGRFIALGSNAFLTGKDTAEPPGSPMWNGSALNLAGGVARVPMMGDLSRERGADGVAVTMSIFPQFTENFAGALVSADGGLWTLEVEAASGGTCELIARAGGLDVVAAVPVPAYQWSVIEIYISPVLIQLVVNGVPATAKIGDTVLSFDSGLGAEVFVGAQTLPVVLVDDLRIDVISSGEPVPLSKAVLLPPGASPAIAINPGDVWRVAMDTTIVGGDTGLSEAPLPLVSAETWEFGLPPPRKALIGLDAKGALDQSMHQGRVVIDLIHRGNDGNLQQMAVEISPSGLVTSKRVPLRTIFDPVAPPPAPVETPGGG